MVATLVALVVSTVVALAALVAVLARANTRRRGEAAALRASEERYRGIFDRALVAMVRTAADGRIVAANATAARMQGFDSPAAFMAAVPNVGMLYADESVRPQVLRQLRERGEVRDFEFEGRIVTGGTRWMSMTLLAVRGSDGRVEAVDALLIDIHERRQARARLAEAQRLARMGSWGVDLAENRVYLSDELVALLGFDPDVPLSPDEGEQAIVAEDRPLIHEAFAHVHAGGAPTEVDFRVVTPAGQRMWFHARVEATRDPAGNVVGVQGYAQDVTERREAEESVRAALEREQQAARHLREIDEMKDAILAAVSHELRTPLAVVLGLAETLQLDHAKSSPEQSLHLMRRLHANARRLERLLSDLLDLDRIARGITEPNRRPTRMRALCERVVELADVGARHVRVEGEDVEASVDAPKVERIVENLLVNAAKHTRRDTPVRVRVDAVGEGVEIVVSDAGDGVPDELKAAIFEPFRQGPRSSSGSGIGLSLVARFAELHGGRAWVQDAPSGGAEFHVLLPADVCGPELEIGQDARTALG